MIKIIDYGLGNIQAFANVYNRLHIPFGVARSSEDLLSAEKFILPGVGAFDHAMSRLSQSGMKEALTERVLNEKVPVLGICVGMQILADGSDEGVSPGLGWVNGRVRAFSSSSKLGNLPIPHMGWNDVSPATSSPLFTGLELDAKFYFLHSFYFDCDQENNILASSSYGDEFSCSVGKDNVYGVQFHPEKSHHYGVTLLKNFAEL